MPAARPPRDQQPSDMTAPELAALLEDALFQIKRVVVGQERLVERAMLALLTGGHCLIEGVPGLGKTLTVSTLARVVGGEVTPIPFTPHLVPARIVGPGSLRPAHRQV